MICVSVGNCARRALLKNIRIASRSADLVEIRADSISGFSLEPLLKYKAGKPLIFTCAPRCASIYGPCSRPVRFAYRDAKTNGGAFKGSEAQRTDILLAAIISGKFEYVTLDAADPFAMPASTKLLLAVAAKMRTKIILAYHNYRNTPDNLELIYRHLAAFKPAAVKIVTYARQFSDNFKVFGLAQKAAAQHSPKLIAFCMGEKGVISRILYRKFGLFLTYASYKQGAETAEGQIPFEQMKYLCRADKINRRTRIFGLLGNPIEHSYSPLLFNALFKMGGINAVYLPLAIEPRHFKRDFALIRRFLKPEGFSVTSPHKISAMKFTDKLSRPAREIGAINTIYKRGGKYIGANTDWLGVLETLYQLRKMLNHRQALILGKGGASKAVVYALRNSGIRTTVFARKAGKGTLPLSRLFQYCRGSGSDKIIINATPVGMPPAINKSPIPRSCLKKGMIIFDTIYNPVKTRLLKDARKKGCITINGLRMFLTQAMKQMECFMGKRN